MKALRAVVVAAFLVVLGVIAYDLHRVANVVSAPTVAAAPGKPETPAEHDARVRAEYKELEHDFTLDWPKPVPDKRYAVVPSKK